MKKIFLLLGCIVLICFAFSACDEAEESKADISKAETAVSQAVSETESEISEDVSAEESVTEVSVTEESETPEGSNSEPTDNVSESEVLPEESEEVSEEVFENVSGEVSEQVSQTRTFTIVDKRDEQNGCWAEALDEFFEDDNFIYAFSATPMSEYVIVEYSDGTTQNVKEAFADGNITLADLDKFGITYYKMSKPT